MKIIITAEEVMVESIDMKLESLSNLTKRNMITSKTCNNASYQKTMMASFFSDSWLVWSNAEAAFLMYGPNS